MDQQPIVQEVQHPEINRQSTASVEAEHFDNFEHHHVYRIGNIGSQMKRKEEGNGRDSEPLLGR